MHAPAVRALFIQFLAFFLTLAALAFAGHLAAFQFTFLLAALLQGAVAAILSRLFRLASWWHVIHLLFPAALVAMLSLHLPPLLFLVLFIVLLALYWSTFRTQVPYYPSGRRTWNAVAQLLPPDRALHVIDIGSGFGGLVLHLAALRPESVVAGIELAPMPWLSSLLRARITHSRGRFIRGDYTGLNFADYDVIFAYLSPAAMPALWEKARTEMRPGSLLLSYEFDIPGHTPEIVIHPAQSSVALYGWRL